jgi:hypothetical protein
MGFIGNGVVLDETKPVMADAPTDIGSEINKDTRWIWKVSLLYRNM